MFKRDPLLAAILLWTATVSFVLLWLPLTRGATQGAAYPWDFGGGIGGRGIGGDYWMLVVAFAFVIPLLSLGWRGGRTPFHWLLLAFHVPLAAVVIYAALTSPQTLGFEGATVGASFSLVVIGPILFVGHAVAAIAWVLRDFQTRRSRNTPPFAWTRGARVRLALIVALFPIEVVLFRSGGLESTQNLIGVGLVGWQWVMLNRVLASH